MDSCYHKNVCNCVKNDPSCPNPGNHECCSETPPKGPPKFGMWVKSGTCNRNLGMCKSPNKPKSIENYTTKKGDNGDCSNWEHAYWILIFVIFFLLLCIVMYYKKVRSA
jgi:hypothetical protein